MVVVAIQLSDLGSIPALSTKKTFRHYAVHYTKIMLGVNLRAPHGVLTSTTRMLPAAHIIVTLALVVEKNGGKRGSLSESSRLLKERVFVESLQSASCSSNEVTKAEKCSDATKAKTGLLMFTDPFARSSFMVGPHIIYQVKSFANGQEEKSERTRIAVVVTLVDSLLLGFQMWFRDHTMLYMPYLTIESYKIGVI